MTMTSTFEERVFLVTSDNPRIHHSLSRSRLCTLSKVFEDMLSLSIRSPQTTTNGRIELAVSETEWQLRGFVDVIRGVQLDGSPRYDNYWDDLAKLADKYDCPFAACLVREKIWFVLSFSVLRDPKAEQSLYFAAGGTSPKVRTNITKRFIWL
ncbi:hypothetical protein JCM5350_003518 [Sporobolomyces pararoseus]